MLNFIKRASVFPGECSKSPILLGYSNSHFCPLIFAPGNKPQAFPLIGSDGELLQIQYKDDPTKPSLTSLSLMKEYLDISYESVIPEKSTPCVFMCDLNSDESRSNDLLEQSQCDVENIKG